MFQHFLDYGTMENEDHVCVIYVQIEVMCPNTQTVIVMKITVSYNPQYVRISLDVQDVLKVRNAAESGPAEGRRRLWTLAVPYG